MYTMVAWAILVVKKRAILNTPEYQHEYHVILILEARRSKL